jgi:hypothetical protein
MDEDARRQASEAAQSAHKHLSSALKHLWGVRIPMGGMHYDPRAALLELRMAHKNTVEAVQIIESHLNRE